ncbi:hypothetical protein C6W92_10975 [Roseovarius sp. A46]|uniref:hypothetical protein n=1 Tax=Roseovarius sp. A46 TaxID=2109331 RepID=UPI00101184B6|nr:hypothetical protein [Roseovarius sp. A46]RXV62692.1 hypothetical protein C6W92_10975 [Roseovarius sp. A46]
MKHLLAAVVLWTATARAAQAHATEQGFVLLLPTDIYIAAGGAVVVLTVVLLAVLPGRVAAAAFRPVTLWRTRGKGLAGQAGRVLAVPLLVWLVWQGWAGSRDPLGNPLTLAVWVVFWMALVSAQGVVGDLWARINPWGGAALLLARVRRRAPLHYPRAMGHWPGVIGFLGFAGFLLADPAPADPARLALVAGGYALAMLAGVVLLGRRWLVRGEALTLLMRAYARVAAVGRWDGRRALGLPGWRIARGRRPAPGHAVLLLLLLGSGSFDGLNETFLWLDLLAINPLEFPGRSAVIGPNLAGLALANAALLLVFSGALWLGARLAGMREGVAALFCRFAPTLLPIALAYHIAHYLPSLLLDGQYVWAGIAEALHLGHPHVTAGFMSSPGPVRAIWLVQAGAVVVGHVIALMLAHVIALRAGQSAWRATLGQAPLALFMVGYTIFGLWLLATPRGA